MSRCSMGYGMELPGASERAGRVVQSQRLQGERREGRLLERLTRQVAENVGCRMRKINGEIEYEIQGK
jgi:hypothetical protein